MRWYFFLFCLIVILHHQTHSAGSPSSITICMLRNIDIILCMPYNVAIQVPLWARLMVLSFVIWYSSGPPAAGPEGGEKESGDTPEPPAMGLRPPAPPLFVP